MAKTPEYADWEVIPLFYAALHSVNYFERRGLVLHESHRERGGMINSRLPRVGRAYRKLYMPSMKSRYGAREISEAKTPRSNTRT